MKNDNGDAVIASEEQLLFLDALRESGETNMFGAGPYLMQEFFLTRDESHAVLGYWRKTFANRHAKQP